MNQNQPPTIDIEVDELSGDSMERHERFVDLLGQYILWLRSWSVDSSRKIVSTVGANEKLGRIRFKRYEVVASMSADQQRAACQFAEATVDKFIQLLLTMLSGTGTDKRIGKSHAVRFKLDIEILDVASGEVVSSETVNRGGQKFFADYWIRWLNRLGGPSTPPEESDDLTPPLTS